MWKLQKSEGKWIIFSNDCAYHYSFDTLSEAIVQFGDLIGKPLYKEVSGYLG